MFMMSFIFVIVCRLLERKRICAGFWFRLIICVFPLETHLSRWKWNFCICFNPATFLCLSQARTWISNIICRVFFMFSELRGEVIVRLVNIGGSHHCLNCFFINLIICSLNLFLEKYNTVLKHDRLIVEIEKR